MYYNQAYFFTKFAQKISIEIPLINRQTMLLWNKFIKVLGILERVIYTVLRHVLCKWYSKTPSVVQ